MGRGSEEARICRYQLLTALTRPQTAIAFAIVRLNGYVLLLMLLLLLPEIHSQKQVYPADQN